MEEIQPSHFSKFKRPAVHSFALSVHAVVRDIKPGEIMTYGQVAYKAGYPGAARAVGNVMRHTKDPSIPFHRVVSATGAIGKDKGALRRAAARRRENI